jgi:aquaporin related protein
VEWSPERESVKDGRPYDEVSIDGYAYEGTANRPKTTLDFKSLTPQERAEVLRLPWTQWMHSDVKNRK